MLKVTIDANDITIDTRSYNIIPKKSKSWHMFLPGLQYSQYVPLQVVGQMHVRPSSFEYLQVPPFLHGFRLQMSET